ncbi:hypothetical protein [Pelagibius sp. Alg239-R121]|uniref:hypothetical protein n=1 Tax=Pelagibius sp. Alg239-R121 TaxID=2993448 RepID=UPI0024A7931A|nr:hypothetical protein [Pelagibius sp. Alg239-R121]
MGRLLSFLSVFYVAVFPHSVHSYILHDHANGEHDHQVVVHQEKLSLSEGSEFELPEADHSESEHDENDEARAHEDCSYHSEFTLPASEDYMPSYVVTSTRTWFVLRLWAHALSSDPPPPRIQS